MPSEERYYRGQGRVYFYDRDPAGKALNGIFIGNVSALQTKIDTEVVEHSESKTGLQLTDVKLTNKTRAMLSATLERFDKQNLEILLYGTSSVNNGATVTAEAKAAIKGRFLKLNNINITTFTSLTGDGGTPTYVNGTDYKVNLATGSIEILATGAIPNSVAGANNVLANYTYGAQEKTAAATNTGKNYYLVFEGLNTVENNLPVVVESYKTYFSPSQQIDWINNDNKVNEYQIEGEVLYDELQPAGDRFFRVTQTVQL